MSNQDLALVWLDKFEQAECEHPLDERWPFKNGWEVCGVCGALILEHAIPAELELERVQ